MSDYLSIIEEHLQQLTSALPDITGHMWPAVLDIRTGDYPEEEHIPQRVYRQIGAPRGSTLYWDQPMIAAARAFSELTGNDLYEQAANRYVEAFLSSCIADNNMFQWGNHMYFDVFEQTVVTFHGGYHELRPITPQWDMFWKHAPEETETYIRTMADRHVYDPETGGFNRHDDSEKGHAFLEAGGILTESLAWLYRKVKDPALLKKALLIAGYSYSHRDPQTGLVPNEPDHGRWDSKVCTSEIGLWAQCMLQAREHTSNTDFLEMAYNAVRAYIEHSFQKKKGRYYGQVSIQTGEPVIPGRPGYWPGTFSDPWNTNQWPTHDYPMHLAEACLTLHSITGEKIFSDSARNWVCTVIETSPLNTGKWTYAENYGRCIRFLSRAGAHFNDHSIIYKAREIADHSLDVLCMNGFIRGSSTGCLYESVNGTGYLLLSLL